MNSVGHFKVQDLSISFGGLKAVSKFNLELKPMSLTGLIGPNGAGKTTVFNLVTGVYPPDNGTLDLDGSNLNGKEPCQIAKAGIARTFQNIRLCGEMTVLENVMLSYHMKKPYSLLDTLLRTPKFYAQEKKVTEEAMALLKVMKLDSKAQSLSRSLSYGNQRRLEIARALGTSPRVLLLDEPAAGLNSQEKVELMHTIAEIRDKFKVTVLLIEHDMKLVMGICERITVLDHGEVIAEGLPKEIRENKKVIEAYLGVSE